MRFFYKKVKKLSPIEIGYMAALIDGEGTITLPQVKSKSGIKYRRLAITISNNDYELLKWTLKTIGVGKITTKKISNPKHAQGYTYQLTSRQAIELLEQIYSYLHTYKKDRANLVLEKYKKLTPRNGKYSKEVLEKKEKFIE